MGRELAYVLINPYPIRKSRTGGVIARVIARSDLNFVGARMYGPSRELAEKYADIVRSKDHGASTASDLIADYILQTYMPDLQTGRPHRVMLLLFEGEDAVKKIWNITGNATLKRGSGQTIRDTYGDYIVDENGRVSYFEPAVLVAPSRRRAEAALQLWARYAERDGGVIQQADDVPEGSDVQQTLVMLKPDNFRVPSSRAGSIVDILSTSGLRIVGVKKFSMTVAQAEEFYGPVVDALTGKFKDIGSERLANAIRNEFGITTPPAVLGDMCRKLGPLFAKAQFDEIVRFITGYRPDEVPAGKRAGAGKEGCLALVYEGHNAVQKIRNILGPTDPSKARPGSVRREFGSNIMVNAAHASDSPENARREIAIIDVEADTIKPVVDYFYGSVLSRVLSVAKGGESGRVRARLRHDRAREKGQLDETQ
ncbi:MAG: nucleoside-diphosphate kinase [Kiritimatiellia bacterium]|jgi:nucleoside diphosphate kinase|nr:nucleoside-diphosphate kinase [Kiritimatiellia bacterium]MDP6629691.1 nucleoside-diphosphate kinase [Kiritimatiellia bacterium]MDP6810930.1 nucleoside-diphosphate kinase [Kiritimatiellia bacterium]MDP7023235.1 nucleoside-diphosphate kinase [Kiritimatiellia bacterium]